MSGGAPWRCEPLRWWHVEAVTALEAELFGATAWSQAAFWSELAAPCREYFVILADAPAGRTVVAYGGIAYEPFDAGVCDIQTIAVAAQLQGQGVGRFLLRHLLARGSAHGAARTLLEVSAANVGAQALYRSEGFEQINVRRNYYGAGLDAVIMQRQH